MSRYTGPQYKGASRAAKDIRREEARERQAAYERLPLELRAKRLGRKFREDER